ncbi:MAG TPA: hypothetical protein VL993_15630 [Stellaceae bacterium]|nr:hypothetical protein [Stellaceae bacterium]
MTLEPIPEEGAPPPEPPPEPPPSPEPPPRAKRGRAGLWVLLVAVLLVALAGTGPYWVPLLPWGTDSRLADDEARIARLEAQAREPPAEPPPLADLRSRVAALEAKSTAAAPDAAALADAAQKAAGDATQKLAARLDTLEAKTASLSAATAAGDPKDAARLAAVADLRAALAGSGPYASELDALAALGVDPALLKPLEAHAQTGLLERALLAGEFRTRTEPAIIAAGAAAPAPEPEDFSARVLARIEGLVTIRRVDGADSPSAPVIAKARLAIHRGNLEDAAAALKQLSGKEAEAAAPFLAQIEARLDAEHAVAALAEQIEATLVKSGQP